LTLPASRLIPVSEMRPRRGVVALVHKLISYAFECGLVNEYFGPIERDGKTFGDMLAYRESESKVLGMVRIAKRNQDTFGRDIEAVIARKLTLEEAIRNSSASVMSKQRLKTVQRDLFEQLDRLSLLCGGSQWT
jgi:hypothetical protein